EYLHLLPIVVDNASTDGSVELVRDRFPSVEVILNEKNLGFSEGNNVGIRSALDRGADYVVLLNPDTRVTSGWLREMVDIGEGSPRVGIIGAVQMEYDTTNLNSWTMSAFPALLEELRRPETARRSILVEWVEGACFAIKRQVLEEVGFLDPIYYAFYEEIDFCRRAALAGWGVALAPRARVHHYRGGSWKADPIIQRERDYRCDRSQFIYTLTEPRRTLLGNLGWYLVTLGSKGKELLRTFTLARLWDLVRMQMDVLSSSRMLFAKWRRERESFTLRPPLTTSSTNADQNPR
ncbi:MAG: glycosyltransferase family 2 protein, partial [Acidobacteriota bacterium]